MIFQNVVLTASIICASIFSPDPYTDRYGEMFCAATEQMVFKDIPSAPDLNAQQISNMFLADTKGTHPSLMIFYCTYQAHDLIVTVYREHCDSKKVRINCMNFGPVKKCIPGFYPDMKFYNDFMMRLLSFPGVLIERLECVGVK